MTESMNIYGLNLKKPSQQERSSYPKQADQGNKPKTNYYRLPNGMDVIDLEEQMGILFPSAIAQIIQYAYRCGIKPNTDPVDDLNKIIDWATRLKNAIEANPHIVEDYRECVLKHRLQNNDQDDQGSQDKSPFIL